MPKNRLSHFRISSVYWACKHDIAGGTGEWLNKEAKEVTKNSNSKEVQERTGNWGLAYLARLLSEFESRPNQVY